jgi:hypothetical protein
MDLNIVFMSSDHIRYENGRRVAGPFGGARRVVTVEPNSSGGHLVTMYNMDGVHPVWRNNIQMTPKPMIVVNETSRSIELRGSDRVRGQMGYPDGYLRNYGITIHHSNNEVEKIILHMHDRGIDIEYLS